MGTFMIVNVMCLIMLLDKNILLSSFDIYSVDICDAFGRSNKTCLTLTLFNSSSSHDLILNDPRGPTRFSGTVGPVIYAWQQRHRKGFGMYGSTTISLYSTKRQNKSVCCTGNCPRFIGDNSLCESNI